MESLDSLPEEIVPPTVDDPFGGSESKDVAYGALKGQEHTVFSGRLQQTELGRFPRTSLSILRDEPWELKSSWHQVAPDAIEAEMGGPFTTMHARTSPRDGAQVTMYEPLKHALS